MRQIPLCLDCIVLEVLLLVLEIWVLTQQQAVTVIWIVFLPGWQTCFKCRGLWEVLLSPRSMVSGVAFTLTWTDAGQLVFI